MAISFGLPVRYSEGRRGGPPHGRQGKQDGGRWAAPRSPTEGSGCYRLRAPVGRTLASGHGAAGHCAAARACPTGGRRGETPPWLDAHATARRGVSPWPSGAAQRCSLSPANGYDPVASSLVDDPPTSSPSMQMSLHPVRFPWSRWDDPSVWVARARSPTRGDATEVMRYQGLCGRAGTRARPLPSQSKARTRGVEVAAGNNPRDQSNAAAGYGGERSEPSGEVSP
jgi:hypothetical protein